MAAVPPAEFFFGQVKGLGPAALFALMLWSLVNCFFGYVIFRVILAVTGLLAGAFIGAALVSWRIAAPSGLDYFLGCLVASGLLGLCGWYLYRTAFAAGVGVAAAVLVAAAGTPSSLGWWIFGGIIGLPLGVATFMYLRPIFIFLSGAFGGLDAVCFGGAVIAGGMDRFWSAAVGPTAPTWLTAGLVAVAAAVALAGMYSQVRLLQVVQTTLAPPPKLRKRKHPTRSGRGPAFLERSAPLFRGRQRR